MSDQTPSVSWRLNDLLQAGKKAKAFAASSWQSSKQASTTTDFTRWEPLVLDPAPEGAIEAEPPIDQLVPEPEDSVTETLPDAAELEKAEAEQQIMVAEAVAEQAKRDAFEEGYQKGLAQGTADGEEKWAEARDAFSDLTQSIRKAQDDMTEFYGPLKKLALHLAEQLVRGELTLSPAAIERLTKEALKDVEQQGEGPFVVRLNPLDMEKFRTQLDGELDGLDLRGDPDLSQGSVKISIDDSAIEDLIEHRLDHLSEKLLGYASAMPKTSNSATFDTNFANPVIEKVIESDQPLEFQDGDVNSDQSPQDAAVENAKDDLADGPIDNSADIATDSAAEDPDA